MKKLAALLLILSLLPLPGCAPADEPENAGPPQTLWLPASGDVYGPDGALQGTESWWYGEAGNLELEVQYAPSGALLFCSQGTRLSTGEGGFLETFVTASASGGSFRSQTEYDAQGNPVTFEVLYPDRDSEVLISTPGTLVTPYGELAAGVRRVYAYDGAGRVASIDLLDIVTGESLGAVAVAYEGGTGTLTAQDAAGGTLYTGELTLDGEGRIVRYALADPNGAPLLYGESEFDGADQEVRTLFRREDVPEPVASVTRSEYDRLGRLTSTSMEAWEEDGTITTIQRTVFTGWVEAAALPAGQPPRPELPHWAGGVQS